MKDIYSLSYRCLMILGIITLLANGLYAKDFRLEQLNSLSTQKLFDKGVEFDYISQQPDSALIYLAVASGRYDSDMDSREKKIYAKVFMHLWSIYSYRLYDHAHALECLEKAREIIKSSGKDCNDLIPTLNLDFGLLYVALSDQSEDPSLQEKAKTYLSEAISIAARLNQEKVAAIAFSNLIVMAFDSDSLSTIKDTHSKFKSKFGNSNDTIVQYNLRMYEGFKSLQNGDWQTALNIFRNNDTSMNPYLKRYTIMNHNNMARCYAAGNNYSRAIEELLISKQIAEHSGIKDGLVEILQMLTDFSEKNNDISGKTKYYSSYLSLKDSLLNYKQITGISSIETDREIKHIEQEMSRLRHARQVERIVLWCVMAIAIISICFFLMHSRQLKKLKAANNALYEKSVKLLQVKDQTKQSNTEEEKSTGIHKNHESAILNDDDKNILHKINDVMANNPIIFTPEFSIDDLSHLIFEKQRTVSRVIKESGEDNFSQFVNRFRIEEACRRINDRENNGYLSLEAIANSVGFKSRSSFGTAFKRFTGLTPSEYQKIAIQKLRNL